MALQLVVESLQLGAGVDELVKLLVVHVGELHVADVVSAFALAELESEVLEIFVLEAKLGRDVHHALLVVLNARHVDVDDERFEAIADCESSALSLRHVHQAACRRRHILGNHYNLSRFKNSK